MRAKWQIVVVMFCVLCLAGPAYAERKVCSSLKQIFSLEVPSSWTMKQEELGCQLQDTSGKNIVKIKVYPQIAKSIKEILNEIVQSIHVDVIDSKKIDDGVILICKKEEMDFVLIGNVVDENNVIALIHGNKNDLSTEIVMSLQLENGK